MGRFDDTSREWTDGIITHHLRNSAIETATKRSMLTFDGPIEADWVENLNSVLDDNRRLNLVTGEVIYMSDMANILFEVHDLATCSPATISRCGVIYVRRENLPAKIHFNRWLSELPKILKDQRKRLDYMVSFFIEKIFKEFIDERKLLFKISP
jgi:dynein heavy chain